MTEVPEMRRFSRRRLLVMAGSSIVAGWSDSAMAEQQASKAEALYQECPKNGLSCAACALFRPPAACVVVAGTISRHGWCRFFDLPD